jgi:hypothetical protein
MYSNDNLSLAGLSPLPGGCSGLQRTADPILDQPIEQHLESIPALGWAEYEYLDRIATGQRGVENCMVLGLADLLRSRPDGSYGLHPRVVDILAPTVVDPTLSHLSERVDEYINYEAYQYPEYLIEYYHEDMHCRSMYPADYRIEVLDLVRDLRANNILTSIRQLGQQRHDTATLQQTVEHVEKEGHTVEGVVTLMPIEEGEGRFEESALVIEENDGTLGRRSLDELLDICDTLQDRFNAHISIYAASELDDPY